MPTRTEEQSIFSFSQCRNVFEEKKVVVNMYEQLSLCHGGGKGAIIPKTKEKLVGCKENHKFEGIFDIRIINFIINAILKRGYSIEITSGYRCGSYNTVNYLINKDEVSQNSLHISCQAADLLICKDNMLLTFTQYQELIQEWQEEEIYNFSKNDWPEILEENKYLNLTKDFHSLFYYKAYNKNEGMDLDNTHGQPYIHVDTRGIRKTVTSMFYYYSAGLTEASYLI